MFRPPSQAAKAVSCIFFLDLIMLLIKAANLKKYSFTMIRVHLLVIMFLYMKHAHLQMLNSERSS